MSGAEQAFQRETTFLSGVQMNFETAKGKAFRGKFWRTSQHDEEDRLRALLARHGRPDRAALKALPCNRRVVLRGFERRFIFGKRATGVAIASVLSPLDHFAADNAGDAPPIGLAELTDHVRRLAGDAKTPHVIGVCSPTGFSRDVHNSGLDFPNITLVLIEPDGTGGWKVSSPGAAVDARVLAIFDPEGARQKVERAKRAVEDASADLLMGSLSLEQIVERTGLPESVVKSALEEVVKTDPELKLAKKDGTFLLYRGAAAMPGEKPSVGMIERIRQLFSREGDDKQKINLLSERRAALTQRRDRIYDDIAKLEKKEDELMEQGRAANSPLTQRRIAAHVAQLRKDILRVNTSLGMLNQQINIISTDIHNLTLIQQGQIAKLPDSQELTEHAVAAEEMLETLKADADLVSSLEAGMSEAVMSSEEADILKEFQEASSSRAGSKAGAPAGKAPEDSAHRAPQREAAKPVAPHKEPASPQRAGAASPPEPPPNARTPGRPEANPRSRDPEAS
ncbi:MAG: hypothetical protein FLDDKLPJ_00208 [Phycisphaerae bacterium]|nr:hypothetical protein [Phycisphaerae bacterium]